MNPWNLRWVMPAEGSNVTNHYSELTGPVWLAFFVGGGREIMKLIFNGREEELGGEIPLREMLSAKGYRSELLVVQHNGQIYRPGEWPGLIIKPGDQLDVLHFVGGG